MFYFVVAAIRGARRALAEDQARPDPKGVALWRLVLGEFPVLSRRIGVLRVYTIIGLFALSVIVAEILLSEATPGPFLSTRWKLVVALAATLVFVAVWPIVHALRRARKRDAVTASK